MTLVSDYSRYYQFLKFIINFVRMDYISIDRFFLRFIRLSFFPCLAAFHFVATTHLLFNVMAEGDMVTFSFGTIWFSGSLQAFIKTVTLIYYKEQFLVFFVAIEEIVKTQFDNTVDGIVKNILKENLALTKICHISITVIFNATVCLLVVSIFSFSKNNCMVLKDFICSIMECVHQMNNLWATTYPSSPGGEISHSNSMEHGSSCTPFLLEILYSLL